MDLKDARALLNHPGLYTAVPQTWADLGCGAGLFTNGLAYQLAPGSKIYAVDKNVNTFKADPHEGVNIESVKADFVLDSLSVPGLDGILMANSFHFVSAKMRLIQKLSTYFAKQELFLIVEYNTEASNQWVPYPVSFDSLQNLFSSCGFKYIEKIREMPSRYSNGNIYSALIKR